MATNGVNLRGLIGSAMKWAAGAACTLLYVVTAHAAPLVTVDFTADFFSGEGPLSILLGGTSVAGSYTFDPATSGTMDSATVYRYLGAIAGMSATVSGGSLLSSFDVTATGGFVRIENDNLHGANYWDQYRVQGSGLADTLAGYTTGQFLIQLTDIETSPSSALTSVALPSTAPDLSLFDNGRLLQFQFVTPANERYLARYSIATLQTVPEPGSLALLGLGLAGLVASRRRSRSRAKRNGNRIRR